MKDDSWFSEPYGDLSFRVGRGQIDIQRRWEALSIINDIMVGLWFVTGTVMTIAGVPGDGPLYFYLAGSCQLLLRAFIRLARRIHIRRGFSRSRPRIYRPSQHDAS